MAEESSEKKRQIISLTGTPGTGKSATAELLAAQNYIIVQLEDIARGLGAFGDYDADSGSYDIDIDHLSTEFNKLTVAAIAAFSKTQTTGSEFADSAIVIDGHLSHFLTVDLVIILRCSPLELGNRLSRRDYPSSKITENVEAELVDVILVESTEEHEKSKIYEIDTTVSSTESVPGSIRTIIDSVRSGNKDTLDNFRPGRISWLEEV